MKKFGAVRLTDELALKGANADSGEEYWEIKSPHLVVRGQYKKGVVTRLSFWQDEEFDQPKERRPYFEKVTQSMMMRTTSVPIIDLGETGNPFEYSVGFKDKHEGIAENTKMGAALKTQNGLVYIDGLDSWADDLLDKEVIVEGTLEKRFDLPVYIEKQGELPKTGIPVPEGTDLSEASTRYLLTKPIWNLKKE